MSNKFKETFKCDKPILAMLHLKGDSDQEILDKAKEEIDLYIQGGVDAVIVENYYGNYDNMVSVLEYLDQADLGITYGVNCLNVDAMGFYLAKKYNAAFVQLDSVAGHLKPRDEAGFAAFIELCREYYDGLITAGVRFKYQPYKSGRSVEEDLAVGVNLCDAVVVTQDETGQETSMDRIVQFRNAIGDKPLIIGAGLTPENCAKQFEIADAGIVGSYFKDTYKDTGDVDLDHVVTMMSAVKKCRKED